VAAKRKLPPYLTARDCPRRYLKGLDACADDYLTNRSPSSTPGKEGRALARQQFRRKILSSRTWFSERRLTGFPGGRKYIFHDGLSAGGLSEERPGDRLAPLNPLERLWSQPRITNTPLVLRPLAAQENGDGTELKLTTHRGFAYFPWIRDPA